MKKILISLAALSLILTACGKEGKVEKKTVKEFEKFAKDNDAEFLLSFQRDEDKIAVSNAYYKHYSEEELLYSYISEYTLYDKKGEPILYVTVEEYINTIDKDELSYDSCIIDKTLVTYIEAYDTDFDNSEEGLETLKKVCGKLDGEYVEADESSYNFEEDEWYE